MLERKLNIDKIKTINGTEYTPLGLAIEYQLYEIALTLIEHGANVNIVFNRQTALTQAVGHLDNSSSNLLEHLIQKLFEATTHLDEIYQNNPHLANEIFLNIVHGKNTSLLKTLLQTNIRFNAVGVQSNGDKCCYFCAMARQAKTYDPSVSKPCILASIMGKEYEELFDRLANKIDHFDQALAMPYTGHNAQLDQPLGFHWICTLIWGKASIPLWIAHAIANQNISDKTLINVYNLLKRNPEFLALFHAQETSPMIRAIKSEKWGLVEKCIEEHQGLDIKVGPYAYQDNLLMFATQEKQTRIVKSLLDSKIKDLDVNSCNGYDLTPLFYAVQNEDMAITKLLLEYGANVNSIVDDQGNTLFIKMMMTKNRQYLNDVLCYMIDDRQKRPFLPIQDVKNISGATALNFVQSEEEFGLLVQLDLKKCDPVLTPNKVNKTMIQHELKQIKQR